MKSKKKKDTKDTTANTAATDPTKTLGTSPEETYRPVVRGRASICTWSLEFRFLTREQCVKFINLYLADFDYADNIKYEYIVGDSITQGEHWVTIEEVSWANNLTRVGQLLEQCDYQQE